MKITQGGTTANFTGNELEIFILGLLDRKGYQYVLPSDFFAAAKCFDQPIFSRWVYVGQSIYDTEIKCDFILFHPQKHPDLLIFECKWQQSAGSVDEKYPYLIINVQTKYPCKTVILLDGGGYKPNADKWMRSQVGNNLLHVYNMSEFQKWANKGGF